jgi:hypothetical protein
MTTHGLTTDTIRILIRRTSGYDRSAVTQATVLNIELVTSAYRSTSEKPRYVRNLVARCRRRRWILKPRQLDGRAGSSSTAVTMSATLTIPSTVKAG